MKHKQFWVGIAASVGMLILILDGKTALLGMQDGVDLCLRTVIPSLFPFFILSNLLTNALTGVSLSILSPLGRLCKIPKGTESILLSGLLGGYPVGAQCISQAYQIGQLRKSDAERMLAFCNNVGPAFLFGMISSVFPRKWFVWILWGIHIFSAILTSFVIPADNISQMGKLGAPLKKTSDVLPSAIKIMAGVCGWVVVFRVIIAFLDRWILWMLPAELQVLITGLLELSNGCCELLRVTDIRTRFLICSVILASGGLCVSMQTLSVTQGLSPHFYFPGKLLQTLFSLILSWGIMYKIWLPCFGLLVISLFLLRKLQKDVAFRKPLVYNNATYFTEASPCCFGKK